MTSCDHGVRLDRYCPSCELSITDEQWYRANRHRAGVVAGACFLVLALTLALVAWRTAA